jgi:GTP-binding protein
MFKKQEFVKSVYNISQIPESVKPEIILCGRSNVGKSSFINSLFNRRDLAKTSSTPGKTRSINYYLINEKFYIVDLPGFGYAKISKKEREFWGKLIIDFFNASSNIKMAFHLVDSRHKPTILDVELNQLLKVNQTPYIVILSKTDKLKQSELSSALKEIKEYFPELSQGNNLFPYSSKNYIGHKDILNILSSLFLKD